MASTVWSSTDSEIDCAKSNPPVILGVADFLSFFRLTIDYRKEQILLDW
ncbi:MAG: hypothetical protein NTZ78_01400 [Candidatus Aureabacteria bacterium]|nr:hypothetical protein [Candidatus Auribacterota bacterium]